MTPPCKSRRSVFRRIARKSHVEWPEYDPELTIDEEVEIVLQVNGKVRSRTTAPVGTDKTELERIALDDPRIKEWTEAKEIVRVIAVPDKLVNVVIR